MKHINTVCGQNVGLLNAKAGCPWLIHSTPQYENVRRSRVRVPSILNDSSTRICMPRPNHTRERSPLVRTVGPIAGFDIVFSDRETNLPFPACRSYTSITIRLNARNTARECVRNTNVKRALAYDVRNNYVSEWSIELNVTKFLTVNLTATTAFLRAVLHRSPLYSAHAD